MSSGKHQHRWWARYTLRLHGLITLGGFTILAVGAVATGIGVAADSIRNNHNPFRRIEFIACLPLIAFTLLVVIILVAKLRGRKTTSQEGPLMQDNDEWTAEFDTDGATILFSALSTLDLEQLVAEAEQLQSKDVRAPAGIRNPLRQSEIFSRVEQELRPLAEGLLRQKVTPVRSILFDKTPETNWDVVWHQDVTIAVKEWKEVAGFGPWSVKQGVPHVQPTASVLEKMVTLRLHLDDCPAENGPLLVVPGSHTRGFIDVRTLDTAACDQDAVACVVKAGNIVAMRPLILHASKKSLVPTHRRVLHIEYACETLPGGLEWA